MKLNTLLTKAKSFVRKLRDFLPTALPQGMSEYEHYVSTLIADYNFAASENDIRYVIAAMFVNGIVSGDTFRRRKLVQAIRAAIAKQIAGAVFQQIQNDHKAKLKAEQEKAMAAKLAEAPAKLQVVSDGPKQ